MKGLLSPVRLLGAGWIQSGIFPGTAMFSDAADAEEQEHKAEHQQNDTEDRLFRDREDAENGDAQDYRCGKNAKNPHEEPSEPAGRTAAFGGSFSNVEYKLQKKFDQIIHGKASFQIWLD